MSTRNGGHEQSESPFLHQLCDVVETFGAAVGEAGVEVVQDFVPPADEGAAQGSQLRNRGGGEPVRTADKDLMKWQVSIANEVTV